MSNLLRFTGGGATVNADGSVTLTAQDPSTVPAITTAAGTEGLLFFDTSTGLFKSMTPDVANAYGTLDLALATPLTSVPAGNIVFLTAAGSWALVPPNLLGSTTLVSTANSGASKALAFPSSGNAAFNITLTANCTFTLSGGTAGQLQTIVLVIRGGSGGFTATLPSGIKWPGGVAPVVDSSAGSYNEFYIRTLDGGATYSGNY